MKRWVCTNCGYIYLEEDGDPQQGVSPGTKWEDLPADWKCPQCGSEKSEFELTEV